MEIIVKKPTDKEKTEMGILPVWECGVSKFEWFYDSEETCLLTQGEVTVTYDGGCVSFGAGDMVVFPKGLSCVWDVSKPVRKHYIFK